MKPPRGNGPVRFGVFEADLDARELRKHGLRVKLQDQPFQVLALLLEHPGEIVTREELQKAAWPEDTFVEFDHGLNTAVQKIRAALGDDASNPRFIETIPRRGYKFIAPVEPLAIGISAPGPVASPGEMVEVPPSKHSAWKLAGAMILVVAGAYLVIPAPPPHSGSSPPISFSLQPPDGHRFLPVYYGGGVVPSPDGQKLVYAAQGPDGTRYLALRELRATAAKTLPGTENARFPFWSPDSGSIGFWADGRLATLRLDGGLSHHVTEALPFRGGSWSSADGGVIVFTTGLDQPLSRVTASGGSPEVITTLREDELSHRWPHFLPDQRRFLYFAQREDGTNHVIRLGSLDLDEADGLGAEPLLEADSGAQFVPDGASASGWLLFVKDGALTVRRFDAEKLVLLGEAATVAHDIEPGVRSSGEYNFAASRSGVLAYRSRPGSFGLNQLTWFDREGKRLGVVGEPALHYYVGLSPDERRVAVSSSTQEDGNSNVDIWVYDRSRGAPLRRTFHPGLDRTPVWSPDNQAILFCSNRESSSRMYLIKAMGADAPAPFFDYADGAPARDWPSDWAAALDLVIFSRHNGVDFDIWSVRPDDPSSAVVVVDERESQLNGKVSPDGRALAYSSGAGSVIGELDIYLQPYPPTGDKVRVSTAGGNQPLWRGDGRELYYISPDGSLMAVSVQMGPPVELSVPRKLFQTAALFAPARVVYQYAVSNDGKRFLVATEVDPPPATVVINWPAPLDE